MNPGLVVKLRPSGPWRIGPDSGARNRVDVIYHSDSLYSAVTAAMSRLGWLEEWLDATARTGSPAVSFSSCFPFLGDVRFVVPPRTIWPPASPSARAARIRWKSARFVPLTAVESILAGEHLDENQWSVDGPSDCLVPAGKPGPFRTSVRSNASVDRLTGASDRHTTACLEFRAGSGLWTVVSFADEDAKQQWSGKVKAAFRLLADTGFGGERSRGWGRSEAPEFTEGVLPDLILPPPRESAAAKAGPVEGAAVIARREVAPLVVDASPTESAVSEPAAGARDGASPDAVAAPAEPVATAEPESRPAGTPAPETAPEVEPTTAVAEPGSPPAAESAPPSGTGSEAEAVTASAEPESLPATESASAPVDTQPEAKSLTASAESGSLPATESAPAAEPAAPAGTGSEADAETASAEPESPLATGSASAAEPAAPAETDLEANPLGASAEPGSPPETESAAPGGTGAEAEALTASAEPESQPGAEPEVPAVEPAPSAEPEAAIAQPAPFPPPAPEPLLPAHANTHPHWLLSLFTPAPADSVDWRRGNYTVLPRSGRIDSPAGAGELKKQIPMVAEGSVLYAEAPPRGSAADVAPEGFAHPVFRAGFAVAIPLPEVR